MKRYLAGADFPDEILGALERHLKVCPDCMDAANKQREALGGSPVEVGQAVVGTQPKVSPFAKIKALIPGSKSGPTPPKGLVGAPGKDQFADPLAAFKSPKNLILSGSLAIVLVLMSTVMRNPTGLFGPRALVADKLPSATRTKTEPKTTDPKTVPKASEPNVDTKEAASAKTAEPVKSNVEEPIVQNPDKSTVPTATSPEPVKKAEPKPHVDLGPVGGNVLVAETDKTPQTLTKTATVRPALKKPVEKKPVVRSATKPNVTKPKVRATTVRRPAVKRTKPTVKPSTKRPTTRIRVYMPDGTIKH